ncbi:MAG: aspartyl protease family protein [Fimbriimonas sp.]
MTYAAAILFALAPPPPAPDLARLEADHRYFELRAALEKRKGKDLETLFFRGLTRTRFGEYSGAQKDLNEFLQGTADDKRAAMAYQALADIHVRHSRYRDAVTALDTALGRHAAGMDAEQRKDAENFRLLWRSVADIPAQTVEVARDISVPMKKTIGLRIPVTVAGKTVEFIFDTGANISCLSRTMADGLGARVRPEVIQVDAISGKTVPARMAEIPEMRLGDVTVRHALALVFEDADVTIPGTTFRLDAILGFPVVAGLRQFSITRAGTLEIPVRPGRRRGTDMCLEGLTPLVQAMAFGKVGTYSFDTGADRTDLWPPFFQDHEAEIRAKGTESKERVTGVGGTREVSGWRLPAVTLTVADREVKLTGPKILSEAVIERSQYTHGNLGQDLVRQFERVTLDFERMALALD